MNFDGHLAFRFLISTILEDLQLELLADFNRTIETVSMKFVTTMKLVEGEFKIGGRTPTRHCWKLMTACERG